MKLRLLAVAVLLGSGGLACSKSPTDAGAITVTTPTPTSPANGRIIPNVEQPVTLTVTDGVVTSTSATVTYTFEVATDSGFTSKVVTKDVAQTPGQTVLKLDPLPAGKDYYWHVRTTAGDTVGIFSTPLKFAIGAALSAPAPLTPADGATISGWPTLTVSNSVRTGATGSLSYRFEVSSSNSFNALVTSATIPEGSSQTSFTIPSNLAPPTQATQYFWRVTAIEQGTNAPSAASATRSFTYDPARTPQAQLAAQLGIVIWPGVQPPGSNGKAVLGDNWQVQTLTAFGGDRFQSPRQEWLQLFDLFDRGFSPQAAIDWMHANGYATEAAWFPSVQVIGVQYIYLALIDGKWDVVLRAE